MKTQKFDQKSDQEQGKKLGKKLGRKLVFKLNQSEYVLNYQKVSKLRKIFLKLGKNCRSFGKNLKKKK